MRRNIYSIFRYRGFDRIIHKRNNNLIGLVDNHHLIPKHLKNHKLIKCLKYDINGNFNLYIMPNRNGKYKLKLPDNIRIHKAHYNYNLFIKDNMNKIYKNNKSFDERDYNLWLFVSYLRDNLKYTGKIPW
jgi:hypothetical protein